MAIHWRNVKTKA